MIMLTRLVCLSTLVTLSGCAVSFDSYKKEKEKKVQSVDGAVSELKSQRKQEQLFTRINRNFYAEEPVELPYAAKLPQIFFEEITIRSSGKTFGTVDQAARNLSLATGLAVRVNPDVNMPPPIRKGGSAAAGSTSAASQNGGSTANSDTSSAIRLDYNGPVIDYINKITESSGIEWEYKDGTVIFSRLITRTFQLDNINPGRFEVRDSISKGSSATTGQTSSSVGSSGGSFTTASGISTQSSYSLWTELKEKVDACLTNAGNISISEGIGSITVTDTKDAVECARKQIERENSILAKQVSIEIRSIKMRVNDSNQVGIQLEPVYGILRDGTRQATAKILSAPSTRTVDGGQFSVVVDAEKSNWYKSQGFIQALNQVGTVVADGTSSVVTTNRVPAMTATYNTFGFLAETKPAAGGVNGVGGVPGLVPGSVTVGTFLRVLPTIRSNNTVMFNLSIDTSNLVSFGSARTGAGPSDQQIQWANTDGNKIASNVALNQNESLVLAGIAEDNLIGGNANGIGGVSSMGQKNNLIYIIIVSPRILKGL